MRLFTGISLPQNIIGNLIRLLDRLRPTAHLKWSAPDNLHVTTKFIGEWPQERLQELISILECLGNRAPIAMAIGGIGWIPNSHSPRILFAAIKAGPELEQLARHTDDALANAGIERETRKFSPHLTLARIKDPTVSLAALRATIAKLDSLEFGSFVAQKFHLYLSKPGPAGSIYTQLAEIPFTKQ